MRYIKEEKLTIKFYFIVLLYCYSLFAFERIKNTLSLPINGRFVNNQVFIVLVFFCFLSIINRIRIPRTGWQLKFIISKFLFTIIILIGGMKIESFSNYFVAILYFVSPMALLFMSRNLNDRELDSFKYVVVLTNILYSVFIILLISNYSLFAKIANLDNYVLMSKGPIRPSVMLGSSITVSYYFNMILPLLFYFRSISIKKSRVVLLTISIILNVLATVLLQSRMSVLTMVFTLVIYYLNSDFRKKSHKKSIISLLIMCLGVYLSLSFLENQDLSRLYVKDTREVNSNSIRLQSAKVALEIFKENPLIGSGSSKHYQRVFLMQDRWIVYNDEITLIDPHNAYLLVLSENGLIGFILFVSIFYFIIKYYDTLEQKNIRLSSKLFVLTILINSMGGSDIFYSPALMTIFWSIAGFLMNDNFKKL